MSTEPEPWLRGPLPGVNPFVAPLFYSFQQAREDLAQFTEGLSTEQLWARHADVNSVGRELRHIAGSVDRLTTYLEGRQLSEQQLAEMKSESEPGASRDDLLNLINQSFARAEAIAGAIGTEQLTDPRAVGRKQLPTTVIGLVVHIAEHTQHHVGYVAAAAKLARKGSQ